MLCERPLRNRLLRECPLKSREAEKLRFGKDDKLKIGKTDKLRFGKAEKRSFAEDRFNKAMKNKGQAV